MGASCSRQSLPQTGAAQRSHFRIRRIPDRLQENVEHEGSAGSAKQGRRSARQESPVRRLGLLSLLASLLSTATPFISPVSAAAQTRGAPTMVSISGRVIVPVANFQDIFEVLLVQNL